jgi:hypothetical protein
MTTSSLQDNFQLALDEMRLQMERVYQASDALDQKANFLLAAAGLVIAVVTALLPHLTATTPPPLKMALLIITAILYLIMVILVLKAMAPTGYVFPIESNYKVLEEYVLSVDPEQALANVLSGYTNTIDRNKGINKSKAKAIKISMVLFPMILFLIVVAAAI